MKSPSFWVCLAAGVFCLANCALGGGAEESGEPSFENVVIMPSGIEIRGELVNQSKLAVEKGKVQWHGDEEFPHGNATIRLIVKNPCDASHSIATEIPLEVSRNHFLSPRDLIVRSEIEVKPNSETEWNIPLPLVGYLAHRGGDADRYGWTFRDSDGGIVEKSTKLIDFAWAYSRIYSPSSNVPRIAITPSVGRAGMVEGCVREKMRRSGRWSEKEINERFAKDGATFPFNIVIVAPDFNALHRWQELSVYDVLVVDAADWEGLPNRFRELLPDWVASGGRVVVIGCGGTEGIRSAVCDLMLKGGGLTEGESYFCVGLGEVVFIDGAITDWARFTDIVVAAQETVARSAEEPRLACDRAARKKVEALKVAAPFWIMQLVLLVFCIVAGPVAIGILAKKNKRINILWVFPLVSVIFSFAVAAVIVFVKGVDPEVHQFAYTLLDERSGKSVTVQNDVILAPFPVGGDIRYPADGIVYYMCGNDYRCGSVIRCEGGEVAFSDGWTPALWPVLFRTVRVADLNGPDGGERLTRPFAQGEYHTDNTVERRAAE